MKFVAVALSLLLPVSALAQTANPNPTPGAAWLNYGPTLGSGWSPTAIFNPTTGLPNFLHPNADNATLPDARANLGVNIINPVKDYGADGTGLADSLSAMQNAISRCTALGGGIIDITGYRIKTSTGYTIPANCMVRGRYTPTAPGGDFAGKTSVLIPGTQIGLAAGAGMDGVLVLSPNWMQPTTARDAVTLVSGFASQGNGLSIAGHGTFVHNAQIIGFNHGIDSPVASDHDFRNVFIDANTCVNQANAGDVVYYSHIHCWPFTTASVPGGNPSTNLTATPADNGSGLIRLPVASTAAFQTGDLLFVTGVGGYSGANGRWTVTVVDGTHLDLQGSQAAPSATAAIVTGSNVITLSPPNCSVKSGQTIGTTANITGTVTWTDDCTRVYLSNAATGTNAADAVTFTNAAYTSGGAVTLDLNYRSGAGFDFSNNNPATDKNYTTYCNGCFVYGHDIGFDINNDAGDNFTNIDVDGEPLSVSIGVRFRGAAHGNKIVAAGLIADRPVVNTSSAADYSNIVSNANLRPWHQYETPAISVTSGLLQVTSSNIRPVIGTVSSVFVGNGATRAQFSADDFTGGTFYWQDAATYLTKLFVAQGTIFGAGQVASRQIISGSTNGSLTAGSTLYIGNGTGNSTAEANASFVPQQSGTISNLICLAPDPTGVASRDYTVRLPNAGGDSAVTCHQATGTPACTDTTHTATMSAGTRQAIKLVASAGAANANVNCSIRVNVP